MKQKFTKVLLASFFLSSSSLGWAMETASPQPELGTGAATSQADEGVIKTSEVLPLIARQLAVFSSKSLLSLAQEGDEFLYFNPKTKDLEVYKTEDLQKKRAYPLTLANEHVFLQAERLEGSPFVLYETVKPLLLMEGRRQSYILGSSVYLLNLETGVNLPVTKEGYQDSSFLGRSKRTPGNFFVQFSGYQEASQAERGPIEKAVLERFNAHDLSQGQILAEYDKGLTQLKLDPEKEEPQYGIRTGVFESEVFKFERKGDLSILRPVYQIGREIHAYQKVEGITQQGALLVLDRQETEAFVPLKKNLLSTRSGFESLLKPQTEQSLEGDVISVTPIEMEGSFYGVLYQTGGAIDRWHYEAVRPEYEKEIRAVLENILPHTSLELRDAEVKEDRVTLLYVENQATGNQGYHLLQMTPEKGGQQAVVKEQIFRPSLSVPSLSPKLLPTEVVAISTAFGTMTGYWVKPRGWQESAQVPTIFHYHGGPHDRFDYKLDLVAQFLASRGAQVFSFNPIGSREFGKTYEEASDGNWSGVVDQLQEGRRWAIQHAKANPEACAVIGGSFGGYAVVKTLVEYPRDYKVGIALNGVYDLVEAYFENQRGGTIYSFPEALKNWQKQFGGNPEIPAERARMDRHSVMNKLAQLEVPLLLIEGTKDQIVCPKQTERLQDALQRIGKPSTLLRFEEGHAPQNPETWIAISKAVQPLLHHHLGLRVEENLDELN